MSTRDCQACGGDLFTNVSLSERGSPIQKCAPVLWFSFWKRLPVSTAVCLECGIVTTYLNKAELEKLRSWSGRKTRQKVTIDEL